MLVRNRNRGVACERRTSGEHFVKHATERVEIGTRINCVTLGLFGREVGGCTHDRTGLSEIHCCVASSRGLRDAEVGDLHLTRRRDEDVAGLHITMNNAIAMSKAESSSNVGGDFGGAVGMKRTFGANDFRERSALDILHNNEVRAVLLTPVVHRNNVRLIQIGGSLRLTTETFNERCIACMLGKEHLHRHRTVKQKVASEIDVGHPAPRQLPVQFVAIVENCGARRCVTHRRKDYDRLARVMLHPGELSGCSATALSSERGLEDCFRNRGCDSTTS